MNRKKLLTLALAGALSLSTFATPLVSVEAAPSTISEFDSLIRELSSEENDITEKLEKLQADVKANQEKSDQLVTEMEETQNTLETLQSEIEALKEVIARREEHLAEQARGVQVMGETGNIINFVLDSQSLDELVGKFDVITKMVSSNRNTIEQQEADKALVEEKEDQTIVKQEEQQVIAANLEANQSELEERKAEEETLLAGVAAERATAQSDRDALVAQARAAEARRLALASARAVSVSSSTASAPASSNSNAGGSVTTSSAAAAPAPAANNGSLLGIAHSLKGVRYNYGGASTSGFDCSGFTQYVFSRAGRSIPRTTGAQYSATSRVSRSQAQPGDLVFFSLSGNGINHVGIYLGGGSFIGSQTSTGVAVASINSGYWANKVVGFGR